MAKGASTGKWILILLVLLLIGVFFWKAYQEKWLPTDTFKKIGNAVKDKNSLINFAIIAGILLFIAYFMDPFKQTMRGGKTPAYILLGIILIVAVAVTLQFDGKLIYEHESIKWLFFDGSGTFTYKPLANVAIFWVLIAIVLPNVGVTQLKVMALGQSGRGSGAYYVVVLIVALIIASQLGSAGLWEKDTFKKIEKFALGDPTNGLLSDHTGWYQEGSEIRYGVLKFKVATSGGEMVYPLPVLVIMFIILHLVLGYFDRNINLGSLGKLRTAAVVLFAAFAANKGSSLGGLVWGAYFSIVFVVHSLLAKQDFFKGQFKFLTWAFAFTFADYISVINPIVGRPPIVETDSLIWKVIFFTGSAALASFILSALGYGLARKFKDIQVCKRCDSVCERVDGRLVCPVCSYLCPACGQRGGHLPDGRIICLNQQCKNFRQEISVAIETERKGLLEGAGIKVWNRLVPSAQLREARAVNQQNATLAAQVLREAEARDVQQQIAQLEHDDKTLENEQQYLEEMKAGGPKEMDRRQRIVAIKALRRDIAEQLARLRPAGG